MPGFRTILTYSTSIDAEVDRSMLRSEGIDANLLNRESSLNGFGGPFCVELQVVEKDLTRASDLIKSKRPERFGVSENIVDAEAAIRRGTRRYLWFSGSSVCFVYLAALASRGTEALTEQNVIGGAILLGFFLSIPLWLLYELVRKLAKRG
jgi:hypothetical protein